MSFLHEHAAIYAWHLRQVERFRVSAVNEQKRAWRDREDHIRYGRFSFRSPHGARTRYTRARNLVDRWLEADAALRVFLKKGGAE